MSQTGKLSEMEGRSRLQTMAPEWRMEQPVCLIESDDKGGLWVNPQAVKILEAIAQPVVVVAVAGPYHTGKSYLMNTLAGQRTGFSLGSTVHSHTKGIWMWCLPHPRWAGHALVLLDTEGLGDVEKGDLIHDAWIFMLAVLLSSTLVYNSKGAIDQDAMRKLHYVSELSEHIKVKADKAKQEEEETAADTKYVSFFPSFIWTLRDFTLDLELEGRQVTEDEYLESTLILKKGRSKDVLNYNLPRQCIREYFPTRKCFVFDQPASNRDMKQLESLPDSALQPEFLKQSRRFCQYVLQESRVKTLKGGHPVTGQMFGLLAQSYVETIMSGKVPCLEDAVTSIAAKQNEAAVREGLALYDAQMKEQVTFPAEVAALSEAHGACERAALQLFMQQSFKDEGQKYQEQLATAINEHYRAVQSRNRTASQETCQALLSQLSADVERKLREGVYMQPGGYQLYVTDQRQVQESFQRAPNKGVMAEQVLQQFVGSKKVEAAAILQADKMLTEAEKNRAADQVRLEQLEQQCKAEEKRRKQLEQQMRDLERSHQENICQLEAEKLKQERKAAVRSKLKEQEKLLQEDFTVEVKLLKEQMEQLKKEAKEREEKLQQELTQKRAEEERKECQWEREEKERQRQWEREEKERQRQWEREEKERQRQHEECQWKREEKERQRQWEREEKERQRQWEREEKEREAKERERRYQHELKLERLKAELVLEQLTENKMEKAATNLTAASSRMREAERRTGESKLGGKKTEMDTKPEKDTKKKVTAIVTGRSRPQTMVPEWRMEQPVCLIESDDKGALRVNPQAVKILEAIAQPVVVVAVVGLYRTGKSYLMNALAGQRTGFSLGSTIQSHTKGIWMWCLPHPHRAGHTLVLLDTEGLGDAHKGDPKHDTWIFTLAVLLSSTLVYNSKGTIDQDAMSKLHFMSDLSEHIRVKAEKEEEETVADTEYVSFFPSFIWTLRDFTLELELEGRQVTEDEYLERALMLKKDLSKKVSSYDEPRECIREYFPMRKCFVFVQPTGDRDMKQLESLPERALKPEFLEQSRRFCQYVLQESRVKMLKGGHPVTGQMLGLLAQSYVETILSRKVISLDDVITSIAAKQNEAAVREGLALYDAQMEEQVTFPAEVAALSEAHGACERAALQLFMQQSFKDEGQKYQKQLAMEINEHYNAVLGRNQTASQETCWALLSKLSADVERKLSEGVYMQPGGYQEYVTDQKQVLESFQREPNKGVIAEQVLQWFMDSKKAEAASILQVDKKLSEVEQQQAADQARLEQLEQQRKAEEERRQQLEQQMRDLERSHQENIRQVKAKMKEEAENMKQEMEAAVQSKLREQKKLLEQGFKEKPELLKEEMEQLQGKAKKWKEKWQRKANEWEEKQQEELRQKKMEQKQKERQRQWEREVKERQHQWEQDQREREAKEMESRLQYELEMQRRKRQKRAEEELMEQEEKERQRQWEREEKERQRQWEREEKERQRQWEQDQREREAKEMERQLQYKMERVKNQKRGCIQS